MSTPLAPARRPDTACRAIRPSLTPAAIPIHARHEEQRRIANAPQQRAFSRLRANPSSSSIALELATTARGVRRRPRARPPMNRGAAVIESETCVRRALDTAAALFTAILPARDVARCLPIEALASGSRSKVANATSTGLRSALDLSSPPATERRHLVLRFASSSSTSPAEVAGASRSPPNLTKIGPSVSRASRTAPRACARNLKAAEQRLPPRRTTRAIRTQPDRLMRSIVNENSLGYPATCQPLLLHPRERVAHCATARDASEGCERDDLPPSSRSP